MAQHVWQVDVLQIAIIVKALQSVFNVPLVIPCLLILIMETPLFVLSVFNLVETVLQVNHPTVLDVDLDSFYQELHVLLVLQIVKPALLMAVQPAIPDILCHHL